MKTKKMSLGNIEGKLSRAEMKKIMAGSGLYGCYIEKPCTSTNDCSRPPYVWGCVCMGVCKLIT